MPEETIESAGDSRERRPTVCVVAHGCRSNQEEMECLLGGLRDQGFVPVSLGRPADWTIINTCSVTAAGESDARRAIRRASRNESGGRIIVTGCFAQQDPALAARLGADLVVGNADKWRLPEILASPRGGSPVGTSLVREDPTTRRFLAHGAQAAGHRTRAALKIQDGCDERCTYCIIPRLRGRSVSRGLDETLAEARRLAASGYSEVTLTGIHSASYRSDSGGGDLANLLSRLLEVQALRRIRVNSLEPQWVTPRLIDTIAGSPRFCRHLHMPLQSGDAAILKRMGRGYSPEEYRATVALARARIPGVAIGADVMVGFPGETPESLDRTVSFLEQVRPAYLHVFPYSERPGVASIRYPGKVPEPEKKRRAARLRELDRRLRTDHLRAHDGETHEVLVEGKTDAKGWPQALTDNYIRVLLDGPAAAGSWARARLRWTGDPMRMIGEVDSEGPRAV